MYRTLSLFSLFVFFVRIRSLKILSNDGACKVQTDQGSIDLTPLGHTDGTARFVGLKTAGLGGMTVDWNPCSDFSETSQYAYWCKNVAVCGVSGLYSFTTFGATKSASFSVENDQLVLQYQSSSEGFQTTSKITLSCGTEPDSVTVSTAMNNNVEMMLSSKYACFGNANTTPANASPTGSLRTGSILCIILLVMSCIYIATGLAYTIMVKKAQGIERIPNVTFWTTLPSLVKDGVIFVIRRKGSGPVTYDAI